MKQYRIGILGGMGPLAGVELQRLIVELTPAQRDQDHIQVIAFTNPQVPDRTESLAQDGGEAFLEGIRQSLPVLTAAGADVIAIPCNTTHSRLSDIRAVSPVPVVDMVGLAFPEIAKGEGCIALLATRGSLQSGVYHLRRPDFPWILPTSEQEEKIMEVIYGIKGGQKEHVLPMLEEVMADLKSRGATRFLLGCTELSLLYTEVVGKGYGVIDPLRLLAASLVRTAS